MILKAVKLNSTIGATMTGMSWFMPDLMFDSQKVADT